MIIQPAKRVKKLPGELTKRIFGEFEELEDYEIYGNTRQQQQQQQATPNSKPQFQFQTQ